MPRTAVLALGGNALVHDGQVGTYEEQYRNALDMAFVARSLIRAGWRIVIVHGNGPQVGNLAIQQEGGADLAPPQPLEAIGAMTQGALGHMICLALAEACGNEIQGAVAVITHTLVDEHDPAFDAPSKPIGPFFGVDQIKALGRARGWTMREDAGRGFRRIVPSPRPIGIVESEPIRTLIDAGFLVVAAGGGGVPVVRDADGHLRGVAAVIDKDHAAERIARSIDADALVLVTGVRNVTVGFRTAHERTIFDLTVDEARRHLASGEFPNGSMGPKIEAAANFAADPGRLSIITTAEFVTTTLDADAAPIDRGTRIVSEISIGNRIDPAGVRPIGI